MSDPHHPQQLDPQQLDPQQLDPAEARIDALARRSGSDLRRPAPADGITRAQRQKRTKQTARLGGAGVAAVAILAIGAVALNSGDAGTTIVPATVTTIDTDATVPDTAPDPTPDPAPDPTQPPDDTTAPTSAPPETSPATAPANVPGDPEVVYTSEELALFEGVELTLVDPRTGAVIGREPADPVAARAAQDALPRLTRSTTAIGDVSYSFDQVVFEAGTLDTDAYPDVDLCGQNIVTVQGASASALPQRAAALAISPDDRFVVTLSATCPESGTMGADAVGTAMPYRSVLQVFDSTRPETPGRILSELPSTTDIGILTFGPSGRFVALETFDLQPRHRVFDLETGDEIGVGVGCSTSTTTYGRFIGPWVGDSSVAFTVRCGDDRPTELLVLDLASDVELRIPAPGDATSSVQVEVDRAHFDGPETAWFTMCDAAAATCWVGQGNNPLVELPDKVQASFLPLGFEYGG